MAYQSRSPSATMMYVQELIDEIIDHLHDSPSALKACSLVARKFYPRTRVHLFRVADCRKPGSAPFFEIPRDSFELLRCIKGVQLRCLDFFLPKHYTDTVDFLHSLSFPVRLSIWDVGSWYGPSNKECEWRCILPAFVSTAPYHAIARLELISPQWYTFLEFHHIVLSLPNVTELFISGLGALTTRNELVIPAPPAPRIRKMYLHISGNTVLTFWEGLRSYRSMYLDRLEELHVTNTSPVELRAVVQAANLASNTLKVLEIDGYQSSDFTRLSPNVSPLHLDPSADLRFGIVLCDDMLPFLNWWTGCFKSTEKESTVMERLTIRLEGRGPPVTLGQLEPLKRAFEELSDPLSKLVRNVDLVFQIMNSPCHPSLDRDSLRGEIVDACKVLKEKANLRVFDMMPHTPDVPVFPFLASISRRIL
ncbi:hypothetical protein F5146DRAFT_266291 [Armillaria mellea]|nr:hypothetical protein F5146DRAFT_266291 [Armillaria mellea]